MSSSASTSTKTLPERPPFSSLPLLPSGPHGNAWTLYGPDDQLGALNLLTPEVVREAAKEIREGTRVCTDLPLGFLEKPFFNRDVFRHEIRHLEPRTVNDDVVSLNTQSGTQWDGLRHFGYQKEKLYYGGRTQDQIHNSREIGIHNMVSAGGITGRSVLLDWDRWARSQTPPLNPPRQSAHSIPLSDLLSVAASQGTSFKRGDILFVRTGWTAAWRALPHSEQASLAALGRAPSIGVQSSQDTLRWLWDEGFAAVAGDQPAFETCPFQSEEWMLHEWCLAGWGMPIGELFELDKLAEVCERLGRWSFWFSAAPLNVPGGVASTGNGVAVF